MSRRVLGVAGEEEDKGEDLGCFAAAAKQLYQ